MTITNGYCTLADVKQRLMNTSRRTAATISFTAATKTIADSAAGLRHFQAGDYIQISGSASNNGFFTIVTGNSPASFTVAETVVNEVAGATVTIYSVIDQKDDAGLESVIEAVSRTADSIKGRRFYTVAETRLYTTGLGWSCDIDDLVSLTSLKTDPAGDGTFTDVWAAADYRLWPYNAALVGEPYTAIEATPAGAFRFPATRGHSNLLSSGVYPVHPRIQVTGAFGYSTTAPAAIREWTILAAMRVWSRKDLVFGVSGSAELGTLQAVASLQKDGELNLLLSTIKRRPIV